MFIPLAFAVLFYFCSMNSDIKNSNLNISFWLHLLVTILAWAGPFLFSWQLMIAAYLLVQLQFWIFGRCLLNEQHDLSEEDDYTFYAFLLEYLGFNFNRKAVKMIVRNGLYLVLAALTFIWQVILKHEAILF